MRERSEGTSVRLFRQMAPAVILKQGLFSNRIISLVVTRFVWRLSFLILKLNDWKYERERQRDLQVFRARAHNHKLGWNVLTWALPCISCLCMSLCPHCRPMKTCPLGYGVSADDQGYEPVMVTCSVWALEVLFGLLSNQGPLCWQLCPILTMSSLSDLTQLAVCTTMALFLMDWVLLPSGVDNIYRWSQLQESLEAGPKKARKSGQAERCEPGSCSAVYLIMLPCK